MPADNIETHLLQYFDGKRISSSRYNGIILGDEKQIGIYIQVRETRQWKEVEASEKDEIMKSLRSMIVSQSKMQPFVGFMHSHKNEATVFKMKDLTEKRNNKGAYCNIYGKLDIVKRLNRVLVNAPYNQVVKEYNKTDKQIKYIKKQNEKLKLDKVQCNFCNKEMRKDSLNRHNKNIHNIH